MKFEIGEKVLVTGSRYPDYAGRVGSVAKLDRHDKALPYWVSFDVNGGLWFGADELERHDPKDQQKALRDIARRIASTHRGEALQLLKISDPGISVLMLGQQIDEWLRPLRVGDQIQLRSDSNKTGRVLGVTDEYAWVQMHIPGVAPCTFSINTLIRP